MKAIGAFVNQTVARGLKTDYLQRHKTANLGDRRYNELSERDRAVVRVGSEMALGKFG